MYPLTGQRSNRQNRYYWGVIVDMIAREMGEIIDGMTNIEESEAAEAVHGYLKMSYTVDSGYEVEEEMFSTAAQDTKGIEEYFTYCRWLAEEKLGLHIPEPDPDWRSLLEQGV